MKRVAIGLLALATPFQSMIAVHPRFTDTFYQKQEGFRILMSLSGACSSPTEIK